MEQYLVSLNLNNFRTVFDDDFANDTTLNKSLWSIQYGEANQFSFGNGALTLTGMASENWNPVGFLQLDNSKSAGEGYGLYQYTGYTNAGQGAGICFIMWRADDLSIDPSTPNAATEIDILESWDGGDTTHGYSTLHYYTTTGNWVGDDGQTYETLNVNLTQIHTYAMDWERGSLTFYIDGKEVYQNTTNVPLDYADGGSNEVMGAEVEGETALVTTPTVQLHITDMSYSAPVANLPAAPAPVSPQITLLGGSQTYSAAANTVIQAGTGSDTISALAGAVTVTGSAGQLTFAGGAASSVADGNYGTITVFGGAGGGSYTGGSGGPNVLISQGAAGANTTLTGGHAGDRLFGSASGNDTLVARQGRESILGGGGYHTNIVGGATDAAVIFTGGGYSSVTGGEHGGDTIVGGTGDVSVNAQKGDAVFGGAGTLAVGGSTAGADSIIGGSGHLLVAGRGGNMLVVASTTASNIAVGTGASLIFTGTGNSTITGGTGGMEVVLGHGSNTVYEAGGPTTYEVINGSAGGTAVLSGFNTKTDHIALYGYAPSAIHTSTIGGMTTLSLSDGTKIELPGVTNTGNSVI